MIRDPSFWGGFFIGDTVLDNWRRHHLAQIFKTEGRAGIEAWWKAYYAKHPYAEPEFVKNPLIAEPYGANPSDWYEPEEIQEALDRGYEWDKENGCWVSGQPDEDDYSEESEP